MKRMASSATTALSRVPLASRDDLCTTQRSSRNGRTHTSIGMPFSDASLQSYTIIIVLGCFLPIFPTTKRYLRSSLSLSLFSIILTPCRSCIITHTHQYTHNHHKFPKYTQYNTLPAHNLMCWILSTKSKDRYFFLMCGMRERESE